MYKCCKFVLQDSWKYCPYCGDDNPHYEGLKKPKYFPFDTSMLFHSPRRVAVKTGDYRPPKKGEWFLSGAKPMAYNAPNDLSQSYHIMEIIEKP